MVLYQRFDVSNLGVGFRNTLVSVISGILFASGWWIIIDAAAGYDQETLPHPNYAIGCMATVGFILLNILPQETLTDETENSVCGKVLVFLGMLINFATIIAATWVMFASYVVGNKKHVWPGVAIFLQNLFIFSA
uniref:Transmembrane protein 50B n=1 Tax=Mesocestoides corti TaxID=53468 RepID=A0A5K3FED4_MESCO